MSEWVSGANLERTCSNQVIVNINAEFCVRITCNYPVGPYVVVATWPCAFLLIRWLLMELLPTWDRYMFNPHYEGVLCAPLSLLYAVFIWRLCMFTTWWSAAPYHMICISSTGNGQLESCGLGGLMRRLLLLLAGRSACIIIINETCVYAVDCMAPCQPGHGPVCSGTSCAAAAASIMVIRPVPLMICCCLLYRTCCCHSTRSLQPHCLQLLIPWLSCPCCCRTMTHPHYPPRSRDVWRNNACQMCTDVAGLLPRILINTCASIAFTFSVCLPNAHAVLCVIRLIHLYVFDREQSVAS